MLAPLGKEIGPGEVKARWAFAEVTSPRWAVHYHRHLDPAAMAVVGAGLPFEASALWHAALCAVLDGYRDEKLTGLVYASPRYVRVDLSRRQLYRLGAMGIFFAQGGKRDYRWLLQSPAVPSAAASLAWVGLCDHVRFSVGPTPQTQEAVVVSRPEGPLLLEGYVRSILFDLSAGEDARFAAWWPAEVPLPADA